MLVSLTACWLILNDIDMRVLIQQDGLDEDQTLLLRVGWSQIFPA